MSPTNIRRSPGWAIGLTKTQTLDFGLVVAGVQTP